MEYPLSIYRVKLSAISSDSPKIDVTRIPCKRTTKQFKTAHGRIIKHEAIMKPSSVVDTRMMMEYVYCETEEQVEEAVSLLLQRAQRKADDMLAKATELQKAVYREAVVTRKDWGVEGTDRSLL